MTNAKPTIKEVYEAFKKVMGFKGNWKLNDYDGFKSYDGKTDSNFVSQNADGNFQIAHVHTYKLHSAFYGMKQIFKNCEFRDSISKAGYFTMNF